MPKLPKFKTIAHLIWAQNTWCWTFRSLIRSFHYFMHQLRRTEQIYDTFPSHAFSMRSVMSSECVVLLASVIYAQQLTWVTGSQLATDSSAVGNNTMFSLHSFNFQRIYIYIYKTHFSRLQPHVESCIHNVGTYREFVDRRKCAYRLPRQSQQLVILHVRRKILKSKIVKCMVELEPESAL